MTLDTPTISCRTVQNRGLYLILISGGRPQRAAGRRRDPAAERGAALAGRGRRLHGRHPLRVFMHLSVVQPLPAGTDSHSEHLRSVPRISYKFFFINN